MGMGPTPHLDYMGTRQIHHTHTEHTTSQTALVAYQHACKTYRQSVVHVEAGCINQHAFTDVGWAHKVRTEAGEQEESGDHYYGHLSCPQLHYLCIQNDLYKSNRLSTKNVGPMEAITDRFSYSHIVLTLIACNVDMARA